MRLRLLFTALLSAAVQLQAGLIFTVDSAVSVPTAEAGTYAGGTTLYITVTGTVNLDGTGGEIATNPDGSLVTLFAPASPMDYTYLLPLHPYPQDAGGDGINHFPGGGANFDRFGFPSMWAPEGTRTTDTTDPAALRFGALVGTFNASPAPADWFLVGRAQSGGGYGGIFVTPPGGGTLLLVVADTNYTNDAGVFTVSLSEVPEPQAIWLAFSGFAVLSLPRAFRRLSRKQ